MELKYVSRVRNALNHILRLIVRAYIKHHMKKLPMIQIRILMYI